MEIGLYDISSFFGSVCEIAWQLFHVERSLSAVGKERNWFFSGLHIHLGEVNRSPV